MTTFMTCRKNHKLEYERQYLRRPLTIGKLHLEQVKDCRIHQQLELIAHRPGDYAFIYHISGKGYLQVGPESYSLNSYQYMLTALNGRVRIRNSSAGFPLRVMVIRIHGASSRVHIAEWLGFNRAELSDSIYGRDDGSLKGLIEELMQELVKGDRFANVMAESIVRQIAVKMYRSQDSEELDSPIPQEAAASKHELVSHAVQSMDHHLYEIKELSQLAEKLGYSYSHLSHVFREEMGQSLQSYWVHKRAQHAMLLLQEGRMSISRIAELLHYQSIHSFSKAFKKIAGKTPREYQRLYQS